MMKSTFTLLLLLLSVVLWQSSEAQTGRLCSETDIDLNDNGLIDICDLEDLDAIRYQLDGTGHRTSEQMLKTTVGCPTTRGNAGTRIT